MGALWACVCRPRVDPAVIDIFDVDALCTTMAEVRPGSVVHQFTGLTPSLNRRKMACATAHNGRLRDNGNPTSRSPHPRLYDPNALGRRLLDARDRVLFPARQCAIRAMASDRQCFRVSSRKQEVRNMP